MMRKPTKEMLEPRSAELQLLKNLNTPAKIQNFLNKLPFNFEKGGDTYMSPRRALREQKAHCLEGALIAALALWIQGEAPLLLDLHANLKAGDHDHVVAPFKRNGRWGAISKTNHAVLRYREPVYKSIRELAMSYFHEYFLNKNGKKTMISFSSRPLDLRKYVKKNWMTAEEDLWFLQTALDNLPHTQAVPKVYRRKLRPADPIERRAATIVEQKKN